MGALDASPAGLSVPEMLGQVNISKGRIEKTLALLSLESPAPLAKQGPKWQLTAAELTEEFWARAARLTALRRDEQAQMQEYVRLSSEHMSFLLAALDSPPANETASSLPLLPITASHAAIVRASEFLRRTSLPIDPRKMWPAGGLPHYGVTGRIPPHTQAKEGRSLCVWGDAGWGHLVRQGKYSHNRFSDDLVEACVRLVRDWAPDPAPEWVTGVPSLRHPDLVRDFAERLAPALDLPFRISLEKTDERPEQKKMKNSTQQARNVDGSLAALEGPFPAGPVLLVDDMVDSRWTLTVSAWLLAEAGVPAVWPLVLAKTGRG